MDQPTTPIRRTDPDATTEFVPADPAAPEAVEAEAGVAGTVPVLVTVRGPNAGSRYPLTAGVTVVGRHPDSEIRLDDVTVSRRHAEFHRTAGGFTVSDLGSLNGTYVNRERVESALLVDRDEIQIGKFRLVFHTAGAG